VVIGFWISGFHDDQPKKGGHALENASCGFSVVETQGAAHGRYHAGNGGRAPDNLMGLRDRALLLIGFAGALRRSELVGLDVADLKHGKAGLQLRIRASKTDQEHHDTTVAIAPGNSTCPIAALDEWLTAAGVDRGPIFRPMFKSGRVADARLSDRAVAEIVKKYAGRAGLDPTLFAGHSLRAGFLTSAARRGASVFKMMDVSRHRSLDTLSGYVRDAEFFHDHAGAGLL
jgi:site-specific recombinase XerD